MKNILVIFMSLLVTLTASEMIFRALEITKIIPAGGNTPEPPKEYMREHSAKRIKSKNPLLVAELDKTDPRVNSIGIRDREFSLEKPEGVFRIVAIGDSVTFGLGVPSDKSFPKIIEQQLLSKGMNVEVLNFGISAYDTIAELELYKKSASNFNPDLVILTYILNDTMRPGASIEKQLSETKSLQPTPKDLLIKSLRELLKSISTFSHLFQWIYYLEEKIFSGLISEGVYHASYTHEATWKPTEEAIHGFAAEARNRHQKLMVVVFPLLIDFQQYTYASEHKIIVDTFYKSGVPVLDMLDKLSNENYTDFILNNEDSTHPNEYGHRFIANSIIQFIEENNITPQLKGHSL